VSTPEPEIHYVNLPTKDAEGKDTGVLQIPVFVHSGVRPENDSQRAEIAPQHLAWFSQSTIDAMMRERYPILAAMFPEKT
jgi:hypothetical protein